jgi:hypothetical protein
MFVYTVNFVDQDATLLATILTHYGADITHEVSSLNFNKAGYTYSMEDFDFTSISKALNTVIVTYTPVYTPIPTSPSVG